VNGKTAILALRILGEADDAVEAFDKAEKAGKDWQQSMSKLKDGVQVAGLAAGAALVAGFGNAVEQAQSNNQLAGKLALDPAESARLGRINGDLFAEAYGESLDQVNQASAGVIGNIDGMIDASDEMVSKVTAGVLNLADTFELDLGQTTTAIGQLIRTGMAKDADEALDIITAGLQGNARAADDLLDTFTEYPAVLERLGLDGKKATGLFKQGLDAGARSTDLVADALKEFQIRATDGSTTSAAGFEALGLNAASATAQIAAGGEGAAAGLDDVLDRLRGMEDPVARNAAAVALFGTQAEDLGGALFALDPSSAVDALGDVNNATEALNETLGKDQEIEKFKRAVTQSFTDMGAAAIPVLMPIIDILSEFAPILGPVAVVIAAVAGAVTIMSAAMKVYAAIQAVQTAAQWANNAAWLANPIVLIVVAIVAAIALIITIVVLVIQNWDTLVAKGSEVFAAIGDFISPVVEWFKSMWRWVEKVISAIQRLNGTKVDQKAITAGGQAGGLGNLRTMSIATPTEIAQPMSMMRSFAAPAQTSAIASTSTASSTTGASPATTSSTRADERPIEINITAGMGADGPALGKEIVKAIREYERTTGRRTAGGSAS